MDSSNNQQYDPTTWVPEQHSHGTKDIWKSFWILTAITVFDIFIYFLPEAYCQRGLKNFLFIAFGILKAFYIVGTFMHMKHEKMSLMAIIFLPLSLLIYLIALSLHEGNALAFN